MAKRAITPIARSSQELKRAAGHVKYEVDMLVSSADTLLHPEKTPSAGFLLNLALDSFLLHYRNLREFLCPSLHNSSPDDIIAMDFISQPRTDPQDFGDVTKFKNDKRRIDKMLAHLSYARTHYVLNRGHDWHIGSLLYPTLSELKRFFDALTPAHLTWFKPTDAVGGVLLETAPALMATDPKTPRQLGTSALGTLAALSEDDVTSAIGENANALKELVAGGFAMWVDQSCKTARITLSGQLLATRNKYQGLTE